MRKALSTLAALVISASAVAAHADTITGGFSAFGTDTFTSNSLTIDSAQVAGSISGTFANYISLGTTINFPAGSTLPYNSGVMLTPPVSVYPLGFVPVFQVSGNGETFTFDMTSYTATYSTANSICGGNTACVTLTGYGNFSETGAMPGTSGPAEFNFTLQNVAGAPAPFTFSATTAVSPTAVTPEPASLALLGTGLLGMVGVARRKFSL